MAISILLALLSLWTTNALRQVPCYFIFGDSLSDNGNNNNLPTLAKVNYPPYGIDFPQGPTGRFSNGRTIHDFIAEFLGFNISIPPFAKLVGENISNGVNYASGSAGIRDETGRNLGDRIPFNIQILNHICITSRIRLRMRNNSATNSLLNRCIYSVQIGSNDYINNYFRPESYNTSRLFNLSEYTDRLLQQLSGQLQTLYDRGARKFAVFGLGLLGCTPFAISEYGTNGSLCVDKLNEAATIFNGGLRPLIGQLNNHLPNATFTYLNPSGSQADLATFVSNSSCCITGGGGGELCLRNSNPCNRPRRFVFWDGVHTTDAWNELVARSAYSTNSTLEASPLNIQQLAMR
ncbi:GDSL esterase/lipase At1g29670-like [Hibiscus syriacus]|uniref:GDSL esterase/lipase At1g29670-like n=1 Tax=Hibiscus syriacus TaxID=106335 RepID=UPI0019212126|nr:GDSL esterase/lipase At1g29670-like [Hibiscus syriacus]